MNILVTGGSGFIGRNIVKMLKEEGNTVGTYDIRDKNSVSDYHIMSDVRNLKMLEKAMQRNRLRFPSCCCDFTARI